MGIKNRRANIRPSAQIIYPVQGLFAPQVAWIYACLDKLLDLGY